MMLRIDVDSDEEWDSRSDWRALARRAAEAAIAESAFPQLASAGRAVELSVRLTGDSDVRALNAEWRDKDRPTNVLSFPLADPGDLAAVATPDEGDSGGPDVLLGDIVLARQTCAAEAAGKGIALADHAAHLMVHGTLHLLGYDHVDDIAAADMEAREIRALARLGIADPYGPDAARDAN